MATSSSQHVSCLGVPGFALVTGAGSGIGRAISRLLAREGVAGIMLADMNSASVEAVAEELKKIATNPAFKPITVVVDVRDEVSVKSMITKTVETFGRLDYAVNCAGIGAVKGPLAEGTMENWNKMIGVNMTGVFACVKEEIQQMTKQDPRAEGPYAPLQRGSIVNIASLAAIAGLRHSGAYTAAKHGVAGITRSAALDHPEVKCNAVVPGYIETPLTSAPGEMRTNALDKVNNWTPMKRFGRPEEVAEAVVWLLGDRSNFCHGSCLTIDGGYLVH